MGYQHFFGFQQMALVAMGPLPRKYVRSNVMTWRHILQHNYATLNAHVWTRGFLVSLLVVLSNCWYPIAPYCRSLLYSSFLVIPSLPFPCFPGLCLLLSIPGYALSQRFLFTLVSMTMAFCINIICPPPPSLPLCTVCPDTNVNYQYERHTLYLRTECPFTWMGQDYNICSGFNEHYNSSTIRCTTCNWQLSPSNGTDIIW